MIKITLLITITILFSACVNKHGISAKRYSDCKEYYDFQGYYHKDCGDDDIVTYKAIKEAPAKAYDKVVETIKGKKPQPNVW
jgi:hypothetical protein